jgi:hypothetical protein
MVFIYILLLENKKFYIGKTNNPEFRIESHFNNNGSEWTKIHKPIRLMKLFSDCDNYDEDKYTLKWMETEGIDNVRGGSFSQVSLSEEQVNLIKKMINSAKDNCFNCGSNHHFVKDCSKNKIDSFLKTVNKDNINETISSIEEAYNKVLSLEDEIKKSNFVNLNDLPKIQKEVKDIDNLHHQYDAIKKIKSGIQRASISEIINSLNYVTQSDSFNYKINTYFKGHRSFSWYDHDNLELMALRIIKINKEKRKELKTIFDEYQDKNFLLNLLKELYKFKIELLDDELSD